VSDQSDKKPGRLSEIRQGYRAIKTMDRRIGWWMLLAALGTAGVLVGTGALLGGGWLLYGVILAVPSALLAAVVVMNRRGNRAMYRELDGKAGATGAALSGLGRRGWYVSQEPTAVDGARGSRPSDLADAAIVFRALGRPGIVLLGEGPSGRVQKLLRAEEKKVARVAPGVPVHLWVVGSGDGQVPVRKISWRLTRMKPVLTKAEAAVVNKRLKSLGGLRPPIPKGTDPLRARVDRKALRGK
jgi:hypothetical protein